MSLRQLALDYAARFVGQPYVWGGNDPIAGFDCSGLWIEVLRAVGRLPRTGDWTAHQLLEVVFGGLPRVTRPGELRPGMLVFWPRADGRMRHVEGVYAVIDGEVITLGASGGGSATKTLADAIRMDAFTKLRPIAPGWVAAVDPF
jgi:hypothetical protein